MDRIVADFSTYCDTNANQNPNQNQTTSYKMSTEVRIPRAPPSTVIASEIDGGITRMGMGMRNILTPSMVASTTFGSEIDGGVTRMQMKNQNYAASVAPSMTVPRAPPSTVIASEIDGGVTRMQMRHRQNPRPHMDNGNNNGNNGNDENRRNGRAHMPAGYEREITNFDKYNK